jgi:hypothetical protein
MKKTRLYILAFVVCIGIAVYFYKCCPASNQSVHITVPNGFQGVFRIVESSVGVRPKVGSQGFDYRIPEECLFLARDISIFSSWHRQTSSYEDGTPIMEGTAIEDKEQIGIWSWGRPDAIEFFVGKKEAFLSIDRTSVTPGRL